MLCYFVVSCSFFMVGIISQETTPWDRLDKANNKVSFYVQSRDCMSHYSVVHKLLILNSNIWGLIYPESFLLHRLCTLPFRLRNMLLQWNIVPIFPKKGSRTQSRAVVPSDRQPGAVKTTCFRINQSTNTSMSSPDASNEGLSTLKHWSFLHEEKE